MTQALRSFHLQFRVLESIRGASPVEGRPELHRRAWKQVLEEDLPGAILLEDGARLLPGFVGFLAEGGYLHADLTQFCHGRARVWRWGVSDAAPGVRLRPLAVSAGLSAGYSLSRRGAAALLAADARKIDRFEVAPTKAGLAQWPCNIARLGALVSRPQLVEPPEWLADQPSGPDAWRGLPAGRSPQTLRSFARNRLSRELVS